MVGAWPARGADGGKVKDSAVKGGWEAGWPSANLVLHSQGHVKVTAASVLSLISCNETS